MGIDRRQLIKGLGSAAAGCFLPGAQSSLIAAPIEKPALVIIQLRGGYNAFFNSAGGFVNKHFDMTEARVLNLGNKLLVDNTFAALPAFARQHMATIGVNHGLVDHAPARLAAYSFKSRNAALMVASGLGGDAPIKAIKAGNGKFFEPYLTENGVSYQTIRDLNSANEGLGVPDPSLPSRALIAQGLKTTRIADKIAYEQNKNVMQDQVIGLENAIITVGTNTNDVTNNLPEIKKAYNLITDSVLDTDLASQLAAAELMIRGGTNVVAVSQNGVWDTHGDKTGAAARAKMKAILPALNIFLNRMLNNPEFNVVVMITAEFARSTPGSDHAGVTTSTIMGKYIKPGSTGIVDDKVRLSHDLGYPAHWAFIADALKSPALVETFGSNKHGLII